MSRYQLSLFIFRRDLRIDDNRALEQAVAESDRVLPCFIFDPRQTGNHSYRSLPGLRFMLDSIADLQADFVEAGAHLSIHEGLPVDVVEMLFHRHHFGAVYVGRDYTPFSRRRDNELEALCLHLGIDFYWLPDCLLTEPEHAVKADGTPYKVFTAFYNNARRFPVEVPFVTDKTKFAAGKCEISDGRQWFPDVEALSNRPTGGRSQGLDIIKNLSRQSRYAQERDFPCLDATSRLSAHLKFGTCSVREVYHAIVRNLGSEHPLVRQLYWRDFFSHIGFHFPHVFGHAFQRQYDGLVWDNETDKFELWCDGMTGFPIVDAGMRELNATGFMHNRVRMITASFLTKDLHISWRWGERYFAQRLVDYDPAINNGNWQWAASTGCDAQPYFRIFNPWLQQKKFDTDCRYIYRWLPELSSVPAVAIHDGFRRRISDNYPEPVVEHSVESKIAVARYRSAEDALKER